MELGYKLYCNDKGEYDTDEYSKMVDYVVANGYEILDKRPECFEIVEPKKPTQEELDEQNANRIRSIRSEYMAETLNKVERYETQKVIGLDTTESEDTYRSYLLYLQYLRDIPQQLEFPNIEVLTFDEWKETSSSDIVLTEKETESEVI